MDFEFLSIIAFFGILAILIFKDRKNIEFKPLLIIRRTEKGKDKIERFAKKYSKILNVFANVAVILGFALSIFGFVYLFTFPSVKFLFPKVFPGEVSEGASKIAFFIPLWYWVIALFVIIFPHELAHGLITVIEKIKITSMGLILFLIFPGAFVEPDEVKFQRSKPRTRMRIASVGSIANIAVMLILVLLIFAWNFLGIIVFQEAGIIFENTIPDTPADDAGMKGVITEINGKEVRDLKDLSDILSDVNPGDTVRVVTTEGEYSFETIENPEDSSQSFMGIGNISIRLDYKYGLTFLGDASKGAAVYSWFGGLFTWVAFLNLNIAIANLLPFLPFDGGVMWQALFEKITKKKKFAKRMITALSIITYCLLVVNLIGIDRITRLLGLP